MAAFFFGIKVYVPEADRSHFRGFFLRPCRVVGVPSPPAPEKPPIFSTQPIMPHRSGGSSWYESLAPLTIARDEQYIAAHKPPIEENNLPTFNPSISLPSYLFLWPDCQRLPQCRSQYADLLLYLILTPYAASLNSLLKDVLIATQVL